jgi:hypothetical protein
MTGIKHRAFVLAGCFGRKPYLQIANSKIVFSKKNYSGEIVSQGGV